MAIARALAVEPELLLMGEPFAALDVQLRTILQDELLDITQSLRTTTLFITHSLEEAIVLGDRVLVEGGPGRRAEGPPGPGRTAPAGQGGTSTACGRPRRRPS